MEIRYFSGTASHRKAIYCKDKNMQDNTGGFELSRGDVCDLAGIISNSRTAGILWMFPLKFGISELWRAGEDRPRIIVANEWINRFTGNMPSALARLTYQIK